MTTEQKETLNGFFVTTFNEILAWEDQSLRKIGRSDISVREMHIIEAISLLKQENMNTMANTARVLAVSPGSLTTAVNALVKKGYVKRQHDENDRRRVLVSLTEAGQSVNEHHKQFHDEMVEFISEILSEEELETVSKTLKGLTDFFKEKVSAVKR